MIYSVHGYYGKINGRKPQAKIEAIVFAASPSLAQELVEKLFDGYPVLFDYFTVVGGTEQDLQKIYRERPELVGIDPHRGYIYNQFSHKESIRRYFK